jgi:hypothetical protein
MSIRIEDFPGFPLLIRFQSGFTAAGKKPRRGFFGDLGGSKARHNENSQQHGMK